MELLKDLKELRFGYFLEDLSHLLSALRESPQLLEDPDLQNLKVTVNVGVTIAITTGSPLNHNFRGATLVSILTNSCPWMLVLASVDYSTNMRFRLSRELSTAKLVRSSLTFLCSNCAGLCTRVPPHTPTRSPSCTRIPYTAPPRPSFPPPPIHYESSTNIDIDLDDDCVSPDNDPPADMILPLTRIGIRLGELNDTQPPSPFLVLFAVQGPVDMLSSFDANIAQVDRLEAIKIAASEAVSREDYESAIKSYTECIKVCLMHSGLAPPLYCAYSLALFASVPSARHSFLWHTLHSHSDDDCAGVQHEC
eukprot:4598000-Pyramimonas_sp.AAC.1